MINGKFSEKGAIQNSIGGSIGGVPNSQNGAIQILERSKILDGPPISEGPSKICLERSKISEGPSKTCLERSKISEAIGGTIQNLFGTFQNIGGMINDKFSEKVLSKILSEGVLERSKILERSKNLERSKLWNVPKFGTFQNL